jgi:hypothetical protein
LWSRYLPLSSSNCHRCARSADVLHPDRLSPTPPSPPTPREQIAEEHITPPSTAHPTPCLFLYDAAEEGFQGLRRGEVPRRLVLAQGQHGGEVSSISCTHLLLQHGRWWRLGQLRRCGVCACGLPTQQLGEGACAVGRRLLLVVRHARVVLYHLFCLFPVRKSTAISPTICSIFLLRNVVTSISTCVVLLALTDLLVSFFTPPVFFSRFISSAWDRVF